MCEYDRLCDTLGENGGDQRSPAGDQPSHSPTIYFYAVPWHQVEEIEADGGKARNEPRQDLISSTSAISGSTESQETTSPYSRWSSGGKKKISRMRRS
jgi:hypothetical protein